MDILNDFKIAVRGLLRSKGFALSSALTLALGIAATTTIFSVVYGVLLRPLPFPGADRFVEIVQVLTDPRTGETERVGLLFTLRRTGSSEYSGYRKFSVDTSSSFEHSK